MLRWICAIFLGIPAAGCDAGSEPSAMPTKIAAGPRAENPLSSLAPAEADDASFVGVVAEAIPAGGYTYLRVRTDAGNRWVATMGQGASVGHRVHVENMGTHRDFHSKRLDRRFETLVFGIVRDA